MSASADNGAKTRAARHPAKLPWLRWSFDAWLGDPGLRLCSVIARGVWIDLLGIASRSAEPGYLSHMGRALTVRELSQHTSIRPKTIEHALQELEANGVFSRDERGIIYSRRMERDFREYTQAVINGHKGGNPVLTGGDGGDGGGGEKPEAEREENAPVPRAVRGENALVPPAMREQQGISNEINGVTENGVNPPVKADSDSESEVESKGRNLVPSTSREPLAEANEEQQPPAVTPSPSPSPGGVVVPFVTTTSNSLRRGGWQWTPPEGVADPPPTPDEMACVAAWNDVASRVPFLIPTLALDVLRVRQLRAALDLVGGKPGWLTALRKVEASPLWRGETGTLEGWRPSIGSLLKPGNLIGLLEGTHDMKIKPRKRSHEPRYNPNADILDKHFPQPSDDDESGPIIDMEIAV